MATAITGASALTVATSTGAHAEVGASALSFQACAPLFAGYLTRTAEPIGLVALGSSTTEGGGIPVESRYVTRIVRKMQQSYPSGQGSESEVGTLDTPRRTAPGIHGYNGGLSASTSGSYINDAKVALIGALKPRIVTHAVGSNDAARGITPDMYKANLLAWLTKLRAAIPAPCVHVFIHQHERSDVALAYPWSSYLAALQSIAVASPDDVAVIDLSLDFRAIGIPGKDPLAWMNPDKIHLVEKGQIFMGELLAPYFKADRPVPVILGASSQAAPGPLVRDTFDRPDAATLGSAQTGQAWTTVAGTAAVVANKGTVTYGTALIESGAADVAVSAKVLKTNAIPGIIARAADNANRIGAFMAAGQLQLFIWDNGTSEIIQQGANWSVGQTYELKLICKGPSITVYVDGSLALSHSLTTAQQTKFGAFTKCGFRQGADTGTFDDFLVTAAP